MEYGADALEVYNPMIKKWNPLKWSHHISPIRSSCSVYFIWYKGVEVLDRFEALKGIATSVEFPNPKGKRRAQAM